MGRARAVAGLVSLPRCRSFADTLGGAELSDELGGAAGGQLVDRCSRVGLYHSHPPMRDMQHVDHMLNCPIMAERL